jgi:putative RecB family exonuclease
MDRALTISVPEHRQGGLWDYVSASRLNLWLRCPLAFRLKYVDGIVPPTSPAMFLGQMVHRGLEFYYRHRQLGITLDAEGVADRLYDVWHEAVESEKVAFDSPTEESASRHQAVDLVRAYLEHVDDTEAAPQAVETRLEAPLVDPDTGEDLGIPLLGIIDLVTDGDEGPLVTDFKTTSRRGRPLDVIHEIQLTSYAYLYRHASGSQEAALEIRGLVKTKTPQIEFHRYEARTEAHFRRLFAVCRAYLDGLDSGRFIFRPGLGCQMCDFRHDDCGKWDGRAV